MRSLLLLSIAAVALAGCTADDDGAESTGDADATNDSLDNSTMQTPPESSAMCLEGAEDCDDTPDAPAPSENAPAPDPGYSYP